MERTCPRCAAVWSGKASCPDCGVPLFDPDALRVTEETVRRRPGLVRAASLRDPFEGPVLADLLDGNQIPSVLRDTHRLGFETGSRWGEIWVPEDQLAAAQRLVATFRESLAESEAQSAGGRFDLVPSRVRLVPFTEGGPPAVMPFHRMGWIYVEGKGGPGAQLSFRVETDVRLARTCAIEVWAQGEDPRLLARALVEIDADDPEAYRSVGVTLPDDAPPAPRARIEIRARLQGRIHTLATARAALSAARAG